MTKIKICGLVSVNDALCLNENKIEYAGFVVFVPKSKRNIAINDAKKIFRHLDNNTKKVAVTVAPTIEQIMLIGNAGFDFLQIHSDVSDKIISLSPIPVIKAFNISDISSYERFRQHKNIVGYIFDANEPGSGKTFDWNLLSNISRDEKMFFLAGGLNCENISEAVKKVKPYAVDVSSGVEKQGALGKDPEKIALFAKKVREIQ